MSTGLKSDWKAAADAMRAHGFVVGRPVPVRYKAAPGVSDVLVHGHQAPASYRTDHFSLFVSSNGYMDLSKPLPGGYAVIPETRPPTHVSAFYEPSAVQHLASALETWGQRLAVGNEVEYHTKRMGKDGLVVSFRFRAPAGGDRSGIPLLHIPDTAKGVSVFLSDMYRLGADRARALAAGMPVGRHFFVDYGSAAYAGGYDPHVSVDGYKGRLKMNVEANPGYAAAAARLMDLLGVFHEFHDGFRPYDR